MRSDKQAPHINAAKEIGALVAGVGKYPNEELRLKAVDNLIGKAIFEICEQYKSENGDMIFTVEQIECINHICLQMFCVLDPATKPAETAVGALIREIGGLSVLKKIGLIGGVLAAFATGMTAVETGKNLVFGEKNTDTKTQKP